MLVCRCRCVLVYKKTPLPCGSSDCSFVEHPVQLTPFNNDFTLFDPASQEKAGKFKPRRSESWPSRPAMVNSSYWVERAHERSRFDAKEALLRSTCGRAADALSTFTATRTASPNSIVSAPSPSSMVDSVGVTPPDDDMTEEVDTSFFARNECESDESENDDCQRDNTPRVL